MGRGIVKEDKMDREWDSGSMLETDERFQTDAEWHGQSLEEIAQKQDDIISCLVDANTKMDLVYEALLNPRSPVVVEKAAEKMSWLRFITSWFLFLLAVLILAEAVR